MKNSYLNTHFPFYDGYLKEYIFKKLHSTHVYLYGHVSCHAMGTLGSEMTLGASHVQDVGSGCGMLCTLLSHQLILQNKFLLQL